MSFEVTITQVTSAIKTLETLSRDRTTLNNQGRQKLLEARMVLYQIEALMNPKTKWSQHDLS